MKTFLLAAVAFTGAQAAEIKPLILSGTVVPAGQKTYTANLRATATEGATCGGSLITSTHILTAAHCAGAKFVAVGSHFRSGNADGEQIAVKKETIHPKYNKQTIDYDFSIIELATPSKFTPVKLLSADTETFVGATGTVMGWGLTEKNVPSNELLRVNVPVLSDAKCKQGNGASAITPAMFCAGGVANRDSCSMDSGGPLILEQATGDVLIGVVSWGDGCGIADKPGVYSKVSYLKSWIQGLVPNATFI